MNGCDQNLRIGWIGFHMEGAPALDALIAAGVRLQGVITLDEEALSRRSGAADYSSILNGSGTPLYRVRNINDPDSVALLQSLDLDVAFVIGWSQILRPQALAAARLGMIGAHASLLPRNRGSAPINWAIIHGEASSGNTLIWLSDSVDEGQIIDQTEFPITPYDTCATLYERVAESNREMILRLVPRLLSGERPGRPQPNTGEPVLPRRRPEDGAIDWTRGSRAVYDFVRALTRPYPGAFSRLDGDRWLVWSCALLPGSEPAGPPGEVLGPVRSPVEAACGQAVACGDGALVLLELEREDGTVLRGQDLSEQDWTGRTWSSE